MKGETGEQGALLPLGWELDENGALRRVKIAHMGRRLQGFDYAQRRIYEITIVLEERRPVLGRLVRHSPVARDREPDAPAAEGSLIGALEATPAAEGSLIGALEATPAAEGAALWAIEPSALGEIVLACWREIPLRWPQVELIESRLMPDHFHGVLFVKERLPKGKSLGNVVGSFKSRSTSEAMKYLAARGEARNGAAAGLGEARGGAAAGLSEARGGAALARDGSAAGLGEARNGAAAGLSEAGLARGCVQPRFWSAGFVDTILFGKGQLQKMIAYLRDNPRRLGIKREHPELFRVSRDLCVAFASPAVAPWQGPSVGHFAAIGNHFLLTRPVLRQVQVSRRDFAYARDARGNLLKEAPPAISALEFAAKLAAALAAAKHGAVIVSPCISHGEREIARQVFASGGRVVTLANKGFSPLYKPGGRLFESCADGRLLMLAPIAWPYQPAEKPMTRDDAQVLNRIAQLIAGEGAAEIDYKGAVMRGVDAAVIAACGGPLQGDSAIIRQRKGSPPS